MQFTYKQILKADFEVLVEIRWSQGCRGGVANLKIKLTNTKNNVYSIQLQIHQSNSKPLDKLNPSESPSALHMDAATYKKYSRHTKLNWKSPSFILYKFTHKMLTICVNRMKFKSHLKISTGYFPFLYVSPGLRFHGINRIYSMENALLT